ncbi:MAG: YitT family protein [Lachnospiraceae bacterium]|nr:YitT family protein [Lachnospiraceae bacterium]
MEHRKTKERILDIAVDVGASFLLGIGLISFIEPVNIAPGGISGISLMIKYVWDIPLGTMNFLLNLPLLGLAWRYLGKKFTLKTTKTILINTIILDGIVALYFPVYEGDRMLGTIFGGILTGLALGLNFLRGTTTGGTDIISYLLERRFPHVPLGQLLMIIDGIIIGISAFVFRDVESVLFAVVALFCQMKVINAIVYGQEKGTMVYVISAKNREIADTIMEEMERGATLLYGEGAYSKKDKQILYCVIRIQEFPTLKKLVYQVDPKAFLAACEATKIHGEGFRKLESK